MPTIAFSTDTDSYISTLTDLVAEIRDEMDDDAFSIDRIYKAVGRAEAFFNRELRVPQMETEHDLAVVGETTSLPSDFLQLRTVYQEGSPDSPLKSMSPKGLRDLYRGRSGTPEGYALENRSLIIGPVGDTTLTLVYYAKLIPLTDNNPTNWLLREYPDLYLHHVLAILFAKIGDDERAATNLGLATAILDQAKKAGHRARWGAGPLEPKLVAQVQGTRI